MNVKKLNGEFVAKKQAVKTESIVLGDLMTIEQVAEVLSVSTKTVRRMVNQGLASMKFRKRRYISKAALISFINSNRAA